MITQRERDTVILQLGNNDLKNSTHEEIADRYCHLVDRIKRSSNCSVVVTALPHHISAGSAATNQTVDKVNNSLRSLCAKDNICTFIDCNPVYILVPLVLNSLLLLLLWLLNQVQIFRRSL